MRTKGGGTFMANWKIAECEAPEKVTPRRDGTMVVGLELHHITCAMEHHSQ